MAITQNTYTGNGSTVLYSFTFPYLDSADVKVTLNGTLTTAYTFANATTIQFTTAPGAGVAIRIYRETYNDETSATFFPGSSIKASDLNNNFTQTLYVVQEVVSRYISKLGDTMQGILNMGGFKITNLGAPTSGTDATTKTYVDTQDALKVSKAGDTMSGNLAMGGNKVTGLGSPSGSADAATKSYVDGYINTTYLGPSATDPTTRPGGSPLQVGDQYFNTNQNILKAWTGTVWVISAAAGSIVRWRKTASAGNTTLSGVDDLGITLSYVVGNEQVYLNGALQTRGVDYTAATGTSITFTPSLLAGDVVELHAVQGYVSATVPDGSVGETKLAAGAVTSAKIADGAIVNTDVNASAGIVASKLSFTQAGAGAVARTVESKLKDVVNVKDFGAVGDGVTDDTAAFNLALRASEAYGDSVKYICLQLHGGNYRVNGTVYVRKGQRIMGGGARLFMGSTGSIKLGFKSDNTEDAGGAPPGVHDLWIEGGLYPVNGAGINGYQVSNVFFSSTAAGPIFSGTDGTICNCVFDGGSTLAILSGRNMVMTNCVFYVGNTQLSLSCQDSTISNCAFTYPNIAAIEWAGNTGATVTNTVVSNCIFMKNEQTVGTFAGFVRTFNDTAAPVGDLTVTGCSFRNCAGGAIRNFGTSTHRLTVSECVFDGNKTFSAYTQSTTMFALDMATTGFSGGTTVLRDCRFLNLHDTPIKVASAQAFSLTVQGCTFTNNGGSQSINVTSAPTSAVLQVGNCVGDSTSNVTLINLATALDFRVNGWLKNWLPIIDDGVTNRYVEVPFVGPSLVKAVLIANQNPGGNALYRAIKECTASVTYDYTTQLATRASLQSDFASTSPVLGFNLNVQAALTTVATGATVNGVLSPGKLVLYWPRGYGNSSIDVQYVHSSIRPA